MELLNKYNLTSKAMLKAAGLVLLGLVILVFAFQLVSSTLSPIIRQSSQDMESFSSAGMMNEMAYDSPASAVSGKALSLSARNTGIIPPGYDNGGSGAQAEEYEVTEFSATIETRQLKADCGAVAGLKEKTYVIFENANEYDQSCNFNFKVEKKYKDEILALLKSLDPKDMNENTRTIKRQIDDYTSEEEILAKKRDTIEKTLADAINSYDEIARVATQARDAESLAKIIDSKIRIIESLSQQRLSISEQLDRLSRAKAEQLDRLEYVYFNVNIYENKFVDPEAIKDSWKSEVKRFVSNVNGIAQKLSLGLLITVLLILQYALYILLVVLAAKFGWKALKKIWGKKEIGN